MKGIILAGGTGSRLYPLTSIDNKHLLPVGKKRMIELPIQTLTEAGITDIVLVTGGNRVGAFLELLGNGSRFGINKLYYSVQDKPGGICDALKYAKPFVGDEPIVVILGDNYFSPSVKPFIDKWIQSEYSAGILLQEVDNPSDFGIADLVDGEVIKVVEKPEIPPSNYGVLGLYMFNQNVWDYLSHLRPSNRGELEITDLLNCYIEMDTVLTQCFNGYWHDMGTFESWVEVAKKQF